MSDEKRVTSSQVEIELARSGLRITKDKLEKYDSKGNRIAALILQDIYSVKLVKRIDQSFVVWLLVGGGIGWMGHSYFENEIIVGICYVLAALTCIIGLLNFSTLKLVLERKGEPLMFTVNESYEEAKAFTESLMEKKSHW